MTIKEFKSSPVLTAREVLKNATPKSVLDFLIMDAILAYKQTLSPITQKQAPHHMNGEPSTTLIDCIRDTIFKKENHDTIREYMQDARI